MKFLALKSDKRFCVVAALIAVGLGHNRALALDTPALDTPALDTPALDTPALDIPKDGMSNGREEPQSSRIPIPADFDRETVQRLLDSIEVPRTSSILKMGYFFQRGNPSFPAVAGFALLKSSIEKETVASRRWFLLQNVRGWAAFHVKGLSTDEGFDAYDALFSNADKAKAVKGSYAINTAIQEYLVSVQGRFNELRLRHDPRTQSTLIKAWAAYFGDTGAQASQNADDLWPGAIKAAGGGGAFVPLVEEVLANEDIPKSYKLFMAAAEIIQPYKRERAIEVYKQAKPFLPVTDQKEVIRFYDAFVETLWRAGTKQGSGVGKERLVEAIALQKERVQLTGRGRARLLELYQKVGNTDALKVLLTELALPSTDERDVNDAAEKLWTFAPDHPEKTQFAEWEIELLSKYLEGARERGVEQELRARVNLASIYMAQQKWPLALAVIDGNRVDANKPLGSKAKGYADSLSKKRVKIQSIGN